MAFELQTILNNLQSNIDGIKLQLKNEGIGPTVRTALNQNKAELESLYSKVLAQKGFLSEEDKALLAQKMESVSKQALDKAATNTKVTMAVILGSVIVLTAGIFWYVRAHKSR